MKQGQVNAVVGTDWYKEKIDDPNCNGDVGVDASDINLEVQVSSAKWSEGDGKLLRQMSSSCSESDVRKSNLYLQQNFFPSKFNKNAGNFLALPLD